MTYHTLVEAFEEFNSKNVKVSVLGSKPEAHQSALHYMKHELSISKMIILSTTIINIWQSLHHLWLTHHMLTKTSQVRFFLYCERWRWSEFLFYSLFVRDVHGRFHLLFFIFPCLTLNEYYSWLSVDALFVFSFLYFWVKLNLTESLQWSWIIIIKKSVE